MKAPAHETQHCASRTAAGGFTLVELLAVICIIGVLAALVLPLLGRIRAGAQSATCVSNLRQMGAAFRIYAAENQGFLPAASKHPNADTTKGSVNTSGHWQVEISPYFGRELKQNIQAANNENDRYAQCPEFTVTSANVVSRGYGMNDKLTSRGMVQALTNSTSKANYSYNFRVRLAEIVEPGRTILVADSDTLTAGFAARHDGRVNCVFADGHTAVHTVDEAEELKATAANY